MKTLLLVTILAGITFVSAFAQFDNAGLNSRMQVEAGGQGFEVLTTANFEVSDARFDLPEKTLILSISSGLENNLGETTVPRTLLDGELTLFLDDEVFEPRIRSNEDIWFITTEFEGSGMHTIKITGTESLNGIEVSEDVRAAQSDDSGCLIATAAYGSEMAPQVQLLREIRDDKILATHSGSAFMSGFNQIYYAFSPTVADWERQSPAFKEAVRITISPLLMTLSILNHVDVDSEYEIIGYGLGIIAINAGIYLGPVVGFMSAKKLVFNKQ